MATKYVSDTKAGKSISAYVILNRKGDHVATVKAHFSDSGVCLVNIHDNKAGFQYATAGGYGYDKLTAALVGLSVDGHSLSDHCSQKGTPKKPKGRVTYPRDFKCPKGYSLANWTQASKSTGNRMHNYTFRDMAEKQMGLYDKPKRDWTDEESDKVFTLADKLESDWLASDDCEKGYADCYRDSGLDYLKAIGYTVIQAI